MNRIFARVALLVLLTALGSAARAAQYTAVDLYTVANGTTYLFSQNAFAGQFVHGSMLWKPDGSAADLTPGGFSSAEVLGTDGIHQFGSADIDTDFGPIASPSVWSGSAASVQLLDATGVGGGGRVYGSGGGAFVGTGGGFISQHALLWNGISVAAVDINPTSLAFTSCAAYGTNGTQQVGSGYMPGDGYGQTHALLWTGSADSAVDLTPTKLSGNFASTAVATDGQQQVGNGYFAGALYSSSHALLWSGTADSAVDLNPVGFELSFATGVLNGKQVGTGVPTNGSDMALLWTGTADSVVKLQQFLPGSFARSAASSIDGAGDVFGMAFNSVDGQYHAIEWIPQGVPEPRAVYLVFAACFVAAAQVGPRSFRGRRL
jgi:hypothetical protein